MQHLLKRCRIVLYIIVAIAFLLIGGIVYQIILPSPLDDLYRFAQESKEFARVSNRPGTYDYLQLSDMNVVRGGLLRQLPLGSTEQDVIAYIKKHGITLNKEGFTKCYITHQILTTASPGIICEFIQHPHKITLPCKEHYTIYFIINDTGLLQGIQIKDYSICL